MKTIALASLIPLALISCSKQTQDLPANQGSQLTQKTILEEWTLEPKAPTKEFVPACPVSTKVTSSVIVQDAKQYYTAMINGTYESALSQRFTTEWSFEGSATGGFDVSAVKASIGLKVTYKVTKDLNVTAAPRTKVTLWRIPVYRKVSGYQIRQCPNKPAETSAFSAKDGQDVIYYTTDQKL
ncbi:hypothetical protein [Deinococcus roseus]|uniref:Lipoprotein n=1 Tax=Deinococcus roseus TaxID=392414 RepID=A0ABQ2CVG1_9DEIO|nr:hypothetical protein [Deinococcus roseus]GGJ21118.1 hypothetical protein GCM10008938_04160 [Deinococcus roseus]